MAISITTAEVKRKAGIDYYWRVHSTTPTRDRRHRAIHHRRGDNRPSGGRGRRFDQARGRSAGPVSKERSA